MPTFPYFTSFLSSTYKLQCCCRIPCFQELRNFFFNQKYLVYVCVCACVCLNSILNKSEVYFSHIQEIQDSPSSLTAVVKDPGFFCMLPHNLWFSILVSSHSPRWLLMHQPLLLHLSKQELGKSKEGLPTSFKDTSQKLYLLLVLISQGYHNKIPQTEWFNNRIHFLIALVVRSPRSRCWQIWFLQKAMSHGFSSTHTSLMSLRVSEFPFLTRIPVRLDQGPL